MGGALHLNKHESPSPKDALCQGLVNIGPVVLQKILYYINVFSLFRYYLSLEKGVDIHLNILEFVSPKAALRQFKFG